MKRIKFATLVAFSALLFASCKNTPESHEATTSAPQEVPGEVPGKTYTILASESKIQWIGTKVSGYHSGVVPIKNGELAVRNNDIVTGNFVLDLAGIDVTGPKEAKPAANEKLKGHLKSADFFEVDKFPTGTFEITGVTPFTEAIQEEDDPRQQEISKYKVTNPTHKVSGNLTLKGITKNISFPAQITLNGDSASAIAKFNIDRTQWNIVYPGAPDDLIRKEVHLGISIKAAKN